MKNNMDMKGLSQKMILYGGLVALVGCASTMKSTYLGAAIGASLGGAIGNGNPGNNRDQSTLNGMAIGALAGGLIGYASGKSKEKLGNVPAIKSIGEDKNVPQLTMPKVRRVWMPDKIEGDKYVEGHYIYVIEKSSSWSQ